MKLKTLAAICVSSALYVSPTAFAQDEQAMEEIVVQGIRGSLQSALAQKRDADNLVEVIQAEDIGKLPDQNLAEVLENVTGIQITRTAGVGTGVQIRGTNANRVEINGVSTVGSGAGRSGIDFEDINASIISSVEVVKASEAKTIEGSVGGTINLKTIRPLDLDEMLVSARIQGEESSLSDESNQPRYQAAFGDNWETDAGRFGFVISGSFTEQEAVSFRPRFDHDNISNPPGSPVGEFLGVQFLLQEQENDDYETTNIATTFEWEPNDSMNLFFDAVINEQERSRDQYRLQASGVSSLRNISVPTAFETVDFGELGGRNLGTFPSAQAGVLEPDLANDDDDPNLRFSSETNSRVTDVEIFRLGGTWEADNWSLFAEFSSSESETVNPTFNTTLNFINPNCPLDGAAIGDPSTSNDNCVPFVYSNSGKSLSFGINFDSPFAPSPADLTDPANVVLDQVDIGRNTQENSEDAFRLDFTYELDQWSITTIEAGYRYNESSSEFQRFNDRIGGFSRMEDSPRGTLFSEILVVGPDNYDDADGRDLFIKDFLLVDPDESFSNPDYVLSVLERALAAHRELNPGADGDLVANVRFDENAFYDIEEETSAFYVQANFETGIFRGNFGVRYIDTEVTSKAFGPEDANGDRAVQSSSGDYQFLLPRLNLVASPHEDVQIRFGAGKDIRRPDFDDLNTGFTYDQSENAVVELGNPGLSPEEVISWDLAVEWYFAPAAVASIGYFYKDRTDIFGIDFQGALLIPDSGSVSGFSRETDPSCPGGGVFNPEVVPNVLGDPNTLGLCVDFTRPGNDPATTTQQGIELAFQYDLSEYEDKLGWASGFGFIANYTTQDFSGGSVEDCTSGRGLAVLGEVCEDRGLLDFSEDAYNITLYYEKYGVSARMRYTWREQFRTQDFAGGANTSGSSTFSFPVVTDDRSQLNASVSYAVTDQFTVGLEAVNITEEEVHQYCVNRGGPLCFVGYPDRRITLGLSYRM